MKTFIHVLGVLMTLSMVPIAGCFHEDFMGYPQKVVFPAEGGMETFYGDPVNFRRVVEWGPGSSQSGAKTILYNDSIEIIKLDWLTVECYGHADKGRVVLKADTNTSGKQREIDFELVCGYAYSTTKVVQKGIQ